jgi:hypothetical protein
MTILHLSNRSTKKSNHSRTISVSTSEVIRILLQFPTGLNSSQISHALRGSVSYSALASELNLARIAATRKQIQRARKQLEASDSSLRLFYCEKRRVWLAKTLSD